MNKKRLVRLAALGAAGGGMSAMLSFAAPVWPINYELSGNRGEWPEYTCPGNPKCPVINGFIQPIPPSLRGSGRLGEEREQA
jgi:hypothetical protein